MPLLIINNAFIDGSQSIPKAEMTRFVVKSIYSFDVYYTAMTGLVHDSCSSLT